jgi:hypothetical protein
MSNPLFPTLQFALAVRCGWIDRAIALMPHIHVRRAERLLVWRPKPMFLFGQFLTRRQWRLAEAWLPLHFDKDAQDLADLAGMPLQKGIQAIDDWLATALVQQVELAQEHPDREQANLVVADRVLRACQAHGLQITVPCRNPKLDALPTFFSAILPNVRTILGDLQAAHYPFPISLDTEKEKANDPKRRR